MAHRPGLAALRRRVPGDEITPDEKCHMYCDDSSYSSKSCDDHSDSHSDHKHYGWDHGKVSKHSCSDKCDTPCGEMKHIVDKALCDEDLADGVHGCKDVCTEVEHRYTVKVGDHNVKKKIVYDHVIKADVTHHVKENVKCLHNYHKDIVHKEKCKVVDGNDCKEKCPTYHHGSYKKRCRPKSCDSKKSCGSKCGKCGKSKKSSSSSSSCH